MKYVIFDMDGVIFDSEAIWQRVQKKANRLFHVNADEAFRQSCCGKKENKIREELRELFPTLDADKYRNYMRNEVMRQVRENGMKIKKGFKPLIKMLKNKGIEIGLATGSSYAEMSEYFSKANIEFYKIFNIISTADEMAVSKPAPMIYNRTCKELKAQPKDCFVLEDSPNGVIAAYKAGCKPIMVIDLIPPSDEVRSMCEYVCNNLIEAKAYLEERL